MFRGGPGRGDIRYPTNAIAIFEAEGYPRSDTARFCDLCFRTINPQRAEHTYYAYVGCRTDGQIGIVLGIECHNAPNSEVIPGRSLLGEGTLLSPGEADPVHDDYLRRFFPDVGPPWLRPQAAPRTGILREWDAETPRRLAHQRQGSLETVWDSSDSDSEPESDSIMELDRDSFYRSSQVEVAPGTRTEETSFSTRGPEAASRRGEDAGLAQAPRGAAQPVDDAAAAEPIAPGDAAQPTHGGGAAHARQGLAPPAPAPSYGAAGHLADHARGDGQDVPRP